MYKRETTVRTLLKAAYQPYKWLFVVPFMLLSTLVHSVLCLLVGLLGGTGSGNFLAVSWARLACMVIPVKVKISGRHHYDVSGAYVVVANHQSMVDIPVLHGRLGLHIKWVMKKELKKIPVFGHACQSLGCIYVDRNNCRAAIAAMKTANRRRRRNASVVFFPEGTRTRDGRLLPFKKGAFKFAAYADLPILPVTIVNSHGVLPPDTLDLMPGTVEVVVHPPVPRETVRKTSPELLITQVMDRIGSAL